LANQFHHQERNDTPFTPAIQVIFALRQALVELKEEGVSRRVQRYQEAAATLRSGMEALGFRIMVPAGHRSNTVTTFSLPQGVTYPELHDALKARGYVIYAGQGDLKHRAFRIANMGTLTAADMEGVVAAFRKLLRERGLTRVER
ncbi:MAG: 2-aminoethylphosphonate aminotransferase, partial [Candidatus Methylomirabilales bacterium]